MTHFDKLKSMNHDELAVFLFQTARIGMQFFSDQFCENCPDKDNGTCPAESGCNYTPLQIVISWLDMPV